MRIDTITAAVELGYPYPDEFLQDGGKLKGGYLVVGDGHGFVDGGLCGVDVHSFFHVVFLTKMRKTRPVKNRRSREKHVRSFPRGFFEVPGRLFGLFLEKVGEI